MPLIQAHRVRGRPWSSARCTSPPGSRWVMKRLLRSTGVQPPAKATSTGMVEVMPSRREADNNLLTGFGGVAHDPHPSVHGHDAAGTG